MSRLSHRDRQAGRDLQTIGVPANLRLDPRRGEEQVDHDAFLRLTGWCKPDGGETTERLVFKREPEPEAASYEFRDQGFSSEVTGDSDRNINVACKARFRAN